jgi:multidrug transporter EmrE-like cation transporter
MKYVLLYSSIIFNVLTNVGFNFSALNDKVPVKKWSYFAGGLVFGLLNSYLFTESLKDIPLGVASATFFSLTIVGLMLAAHFGFGEVISTGKLVGVAFILTGVVIVAIK